MIFWKKTPKKRNELKKHMMENTKATVASYKVPSWSLKQENLTQ